MNKIVCEPQKDIIDLLKKNVDNIDEKVFSHLITQNDEPAAFVYYDHYKPKISIDLHWHAVKKTNYLNKHIVKTIFDYCFNFCNVNKVNAIIPIVKKDVIAYSIRMGFQLEGIIRNANIDGSDDYYAGMLRNECRWL